MRSNSIDTDCENKLFKISQREIAQFLFLKNGKTGGIFAASTVLILLLYGIFLSDLRFVILSIMLLFILIPMVYSFIFIKDMLHPDIAFNTLPHSLNYSTDFDSLIIRIYKKESLNKSESDTGNMQVAGSNLVSGRSQQEKEKETDIDTQKDAVDDEILSVCATKTLNISQLGKPYLGMKNIIYPIGEYGWIFIPYQYLKNDKNLEKLLGYGQE